MTIPVSNITENYAALSILRESQLNTAMDYIDVQFNTYTANNFYQLSKDIFGDDYDYNNDGDATLVSPLIDSFASLSGDTTVTGAWTFEGAVSIEDTVESISTFTSSGQMRCKAFLDSAAQTIPDATNTAINFDNESFDVGSMHDNAVLSNRINIPSGGAGLYVFQAQISFEPNVTGKREAAIYKNGVVMAAAREITNSATEQTILSVYTEDQASDGDYYEAVVYQNSGGDLDVIQGAAYTFFNCIKVW